MAQPDTPTNPLKRPRPSSPSSPRKPPHQTPTKSSLGHPHPHLVQITPDRNRLRQRGSVSPKKGPKGPLEQQQRDRERANAGRGAGRIRGGAGGEWEDDGLELDEIEDVGVRSVVARVRGLRREIEELEAQVRRERERVEREARGLEEDGRDGGEGFDREVDVEALVNSMLASNDEKLAEHTARVTARRNARREIPSAKPIVLDDPLPSLRAFSNLTYTRLETRVLGRVLPGTGEDEDMDEETRARGGVYREERLGGYAGDREMFFRVRMVVDTRNFSVSELECEVSGWAKKELRPHIDSCISFRNPSALLTSLSSFSRQSLLRSKTFALLSRARPDLVPTLPNTTTAATTAPLPLTAPLTPAEITLHQGRTILRLRPRPAPSARNPRDRRPVATDRVRGGMELLLSWEIVVDGQGEARSRVRMAARWSEGWEEGEGGGDGAEVLGRVEGMFEGLVERKGVLGAARSVVELLMPRGGEEGGG